jgi:hypothetical protein
MNCGDATQAIDLLPDDVLTQEMREELIAAHHKFEETMDDAEDARDEAKLYKDQMRALAKKLTWAERWLPWINTANPSMGEYHEFNKLRKQADRQTFKLHWAARAQLRDYMLKFSKPAEIWAQTTDARFAGVDWGPVAAALTRADSKMAVDKRELAIAPVEEARKLIAEAVAKLEKHAEAGDVDALRMAGIATEISEVYLKLSENDERGIVLAERFFKKLNDRTRQFPPRFLGTP